MQCQKIDGGRCSLCDIVEFVAGKHKYIPGFHGVGYISHTVGACAGHNIGDLKLRMSVLGDGSDIKGSCDIEHFQQNVSVSGTDLTDLLLHFVHPFEFVRLFYETIRYLLKNDKPTIIVYSVPVKYGKVNNINLSK